MHMFKLAGALSLSGVLSLGIAAPAYSAPITPLSASVKPATQASNAIQVRFGGFRGGWGGWGGGWGWRGGGWGPGLGAVAAGAVIGGALAAPYYYGAPYYAYDDYDYGYSYPYEYSTTTVVVAPRPGYWGGDPYWRGGFRWGPGW